MSLSEKLIAAAKKGNAREVRKLLGRGAHFAKDQFGNTALHEAAWNGSKDIVKVLLGSFCFVDSINNSGFTPLHLASQNGHVKVAKTLLKWKADPRLLNEHGETALHLVAKYNHACVVGAFGVFRVSMDLRGKDGNTALHISAKLGNSEVMKSLLHHGADPTVANMRGLKALDYAECGNYKDCIKLLQSALLKWKPKSVHHVKNEYAGDLQPKAIKRAETYSSHSPKAEKIKTKDGASPKIHSSAYKLRLKKGYFNEDEPRDKVYGRRYFSASQEGLDSFSYGGGGGSRGGGGGGGVGGGLEGKENVHPPSDHQTPSPSSSKNASIDQLLNEIEREFYGPGYKSPPPPQDQDKGLITPYAEIWQIEHPRSSSMDSTHPMLASTPHDGRSHFRSFSQEHYDMLKPSSLVNENYDNINLTSHSSAPNSTRNSSHFSQCNHDDDIDDGRDYAQIADSPLRHDLRIRTSNVARTSYSESPSRSPRHKSSVAPGRGLAGRQQLVRLGEQEDMDTYVYMAPVNDFADLDGTCASGATGKGVEHEAESGSEVSIHMPDASTSSDVSSENGSRNSKRAIICNSPMQADRKHEPNTSLEPIKGILSQSSNGDNDKSQLEQYLQEELETMRQAFQIRLGQLEKRYQKQLIMEQSKNHGGSRHAPSSGATRKRRKNSLSSDQTFSSQRRNSWHSYISSEDELDKLAQPDNPRSRSSLGVDSDQGLGISDAEEWNENEMAENRKKKKNKGVRIARDAYDIHDDSVDSCLDEDSKQKQHQKQPLPLSLSPGRQEILAKPMRSKEEAGLKGGARSWKDESSPRPSSVDVPQLSPDHNELKDETAVDRVAKELIQHKIEEYRHKMMKYFQEKSEAQITVIEEKYQKQIDEVRRKYCERAGGVMAVASPSPSPSSSSSHHGHRTPRNSCDESNSVDVQTLV